MHPPNEKRRPRLEGRRSENDQLGRQIGSEKYNAPVSGATALKIAIIDAYSYGQLSQVAAVTLIRLFELKAA
jgi:hypothetical protein